MTSIPISISSTNSSLQITPDQEIKNPLDAIQYVNAIELFPDPAFQLKGILVITLNDALLFSSLISGYFSRFTKFSVPLNFQKIDRQGKIKIFVYNGLGDGSPINLTGTIQISSNNIDNSSGSVTSAVPAGSDSTLLFPFQSYSVGVYTQQFDLIGYKKINLMIAASVYVAATVFSRTGGGFSGNGNEVDNNLGTFEGATGAAGFTSSEIVDFGSKANRILAVKWAETQPGNGGTFKIETADDSAFTVNKVTVYTNTRNSSDPAIPTTVFTDVLRSFRYVRITFSDAGGGGSVCQYSLYEVYDSIQFGGTAALSFEIFEIGSQQWLEIVPAASIGTITTGSSIVKQLGDTAALTNLNVLFSSNFAGLRAKLTITGSGGIITSVSIQRVA